MTGLEPGPPSDDVALRRAHPGDAAGIYALSLRALHQSAASFYTHAQLHAWASLRTLACHEQMVRETFLLVAEDDGQLLGFANLEPERGLVDQLFVDPSAGGRGVATRLLAALEQHAISVGLLRLDSHASKRAIGVFERCGFLILAVERVPIGDEVLERFHVQKTLHRP